MYSKNLYLNVVLIVMYFTVCDSFECAKNSSGFLTDPGSGQCHLEVINPANDPSEPKKQIMITSASDDSLPCCIRDLDKKTLDENKIIFVKNSVLSLTKFVSAFNGHTDELTTDRLYIEYSRINSVPRDAFGSFKRIRKVSLHGNGITSLVPRSFYNLKYLQQLDLSNNSITSLPRHVFFDLPELIKIKLFLNKIVTIHPEAFVSIPSLRHISFADNHLSAIDLAMFGHSRNLFDMNLSYNRITRINDDVRHICHVRKLLCTLWKHDLFVSNGDTLFRGSKQTHYLDHNQLTYVSPNGSCMINLNDITLNNNNLTSLPGELSAIFHHKTATPIIENNPWVCDCRIQWLIDLAIQSAIADSVTCAIPDNITMQVFNKTALHCGSSLEFNSQKTPSHGPLFYVVLLSCLGLVSMSCILASIACVRKRRKTRHPSTDTMSSIHITPIQQFPCGMVTNANYTRLCSNSSTISSASSTYMNISILKVGKLLGSGAFGEVFEGYSGDIEDGKKKVAIKMIKENSSAQEFTALEQEFKQLTQIDRHPHIIQVFSTGKIDGSFVMVMEMADHGDLLTYLKEIYDRDDHVINSLDSAEEKYYLQHYQPRVFTFMLHVARGMEYLSHLKILHRDLAARNILLCTGPVAKIADFGLSRDVYESGYYYQDIQGRLPYKWLSPETLLNGRSTLKSDVWSFGILIWEVVTLGSNPYPGIPPVILIDMYRNGYVMPQPSLCPDNIYAIMKKCWDHCIESRPDFTYIVDQLDDVIQSRTNENLATTEPEELIQLIPGI